MQISPVSIAALQTTKSKHVALKTNSTLVFAGSRNRYSVRRFPKRRLRRLLEWMRQLLTESVRTLMVIGLLGGGLVLAAGITVRLRKTMAQPVPAPASNSEQAQQHEKTPKFAPLELQEPVDSAPQQNEPAVEEPIAAPQVVAPEQPPRLPEDREADERLGDFYLPPGYNSVPLSPARDKDVYYSIGRAESNAFELANERISSVHAEICRRGNKYWIRDLESKNGTIVHLPSGEQVPLKRDKFFKLPVGSSILMGGEWFYFDVRNGQIILSSPGLQQAIQFQRTHRIGYDEKILPGYRDAGRAHEFDPLSGKLRSKPSREMIVVLDDAEDQVLANVVREIQEDFRNHPRWSEEEKIQHIARRVEELMRNNDPDEVDRILGVGQNQQHYEVKLGDLIEKRIGVCRHRALLTKVLADRTGLRAKLVRGNFYMAGQGGGHAWNVFELESGQKRLVDVMHGKIVSLNHPYAKFYYDIRSGKSIYEGGVEQQTMAFEVGGGHTGHTVLANAPVELAYRF